MIDIEDLRAAHEAVFGDSACPQWARESLDRYASHGIQPGDFLRAVLENNLTEAAGRADVESGQLLAAIAGYVYRHVPAQSRGSSVAVTAWLAMHAARRSAEAKRTAAPQGDD